MNRMLNHVWCSLRIVFLYLKIFSCDLFNKYNAVIEKTVDNEELTECMKGDPVIYFRSSKDFKIAWKEKCKERNNLCSGKRCILYQGKNKANKVNTARTSSMNRREVYETGRSVKAFCFKRPYRPYYSLPNSQSKSEKFRIWNFKFRIRFSTLR